MKVFKISFRKMLNKDSKISYEFNYISDLNMDKVYNDYTSLYQENNSGVACYLKDNFNVVSIQVFAEREPINKEVFESLIESSVDFFNNDYFSEE